MGFSYLKIVLFVDFLFSCHYHQKCMQLVTTCLLLSYATAQLEKIVVSD